MMTHDDTHAAPAWSLLSMNGAAADTRLFSPHAASPQKWCSFGPPDNIKVYKKYDYLFLFSIPPTAEVARTEDTLYQPSLVTGHMSRYHGAESCV